MKQKEVRGALAQPANNMEMVMNKNKPRLKLWKYVCSNCGNTDKTMERGYGVPANIKLCHRCGYTMSPKETSININSKRKETLTIKL